MKAVFHDIEISKTLFGENAINIIIPTHLKTPQNCFRLGLRPGPRWGSSRRSSILPSWLGIPLSHGAYMASELGGSRLDLRRLRRLGYGSPFCGVQKILKL